MSSYISSGIISFLSFRLVTFKNSNVNSYAANMTIIFKATKRSMNGMFGLFLREFKLNLIVFDQKSAQSVIRHNKTALRCPRKEIIDDKSGRYFYLTL